MCGIIGYIGPKPVVPVLVEGLRRLEYRGYDSAGVALVRGGRVELRRSAGKLDRLVEVIENDPVDGDYGLGHTRWATHGRPTEENAHPHRDSTGRIVVVHNGIIENHLELKRELEAGGHRFQTETDTEVVAHLVEAEWRGDGLEAAARRALARVRGLFALVLLAADDPGKLVAVREGAADPRGRGRRGVPRRVGRARGPEAQPGRGVPRQPRDGRHHRRRRDLHRLRRGAGRPPPPSASTGIR